MCASGILYIVVAFAFFVSVYPDRYGRFVCQSALLTGDLLVSHRKIRLISAPLLLLVPHFKTNVPCFRLWCYQASI